MLLAGRSVPLGAMGDGDKRRETAAWLPDRVVASVDVWQLDGRGHFSYRKCGNRAELLLRAEVDVSGSHHLRDRECCVRIRVVSMEEVGILRLHSHSGSDNYGQLDERSQYLSSSPWARRGGSPIRRSPHRQRE